MKNIIVIGATGYIGTEISKKLKTQGHNVIGTSSTELDISSLESIDSFFTKLNIESLDAIIFAHSYLEREIFKGSQKGKQLSHQDYELNKKFLEINTLNTVYLLGKVEEILKKSTNPNIVFLGSLVGKKALNAPLIFSATKGALNGLVESLSKELGRYNVKVNSVDPGILDGGVSDLICDDDKQSYLSHCALRRFGKASEVANVCTWLATDNTFITGKPFVLDGAL